MMMLEVIDPTELVIVVLSVAAASLAGYSTRSALLDRAATRRQAINGPVAMWANAAIWSAIMRLGKSSLLVLTGVILLALPPGGGDAWSAWLVELWELFLAGAAGLLLLAGVHDAETRRLLRESLDPAWDGIERRKENRDG